MHVDTKLANIFSTTANYGILKALAGRRRLLTLVLTGLVAMQVLQTASAATVAHYFVGTYTAGAKHGVVTVQLVEALPGGAGYIGWITVDGIDYLGNIFVTDTTVDIKWYAASSNYQIPLGAIRGTISADGTSISGSFRQGVRIGACHLTAA